jgi:hypothetical protein
VLKDFLHDIDVSLALSGFSSMKQVDSSIIRMKK